MALVEEELPGVNKGEYRSYRFARLWDDAPMIDALFYARTQNSLLLFSGLYIVVCVCAVRSDFRVREDSAIAHRLQEQECKNTVCYLSTHACIKFCTSVVLKLSEGVSMFCVGNYMKSQVTISYHNCLTKDGHLSTSEACMCIGCKSLTIQHLH